MTTHGINGHCPACGLTGIVVSTDGEGGFNLLCTNADCPRPTALADLIRTPEIHHRVKFYYGSFAVKHPLVERVDDDLFYCRLHERLTALGGPPDWVATVPYAVRRHNSVEFRILDDSDNDPDRWLVEQTRPAPSTHSTFV